MNTNNPNESAWSSRNERLVRQTRQMTPKKLAPDFIFKEECYAIIGACFEVYKDKGCGFYKPVYQECLGIEVIR